MDAAVASIASGQRASTSRTRERRSVVARPAAGSRSDEPRAPAARGRRGCGAGRRARSTPSRAPPTRRCRARRCARRVPARRRVACRRHRAARDRRRAAGAARSRSRVRPRSRRRRRDRATAGSKIESSSGSESRPPSGMPPVTWRSSGSRPGITMSAPTRWATSRRTAPTSASTASSGACRRLAPQPPHRDLFEEPAQVFLEHHREHDHQHGEEALEDPDRHLEFELARDEERQRRRSRHRRARAAPARAAATKARPQHRA